MVYKTTATVLLISCLVCSLQGQSVLTSSGEEFVNNGYAMSWTLGEVMTETYSSSGLVLTQGQQQVEENVLSSTVELGEMSIELYPNPTSNELSIRTEEQGISYELRDAKGRLVVPNTAILGTEDVIRMSHLSPGLYIVNVISEGNAKSFKIIKL
ncbi:MAG: T9SS type A sorting domain-containing protein [Bacteroidota bacterium]